MGRPPKPSAIKKLQGTYRPDRSPNEAHPAVEVPPMPKGMSAAAKEHWDYYAEMLVGLRLLTVADWGAFTRICTVWGRIRELERSLAKTGYTNVTAKGYVQQRPEVAMLHKAEVEYRQLTDRFGLNPAARSRVQMVPEASEDPAAEMLFGTPKLVSGK